MRSITVPALSLLAALLLAACSAAAGAPAVPISGNPTALAAPAATAAPAPTAAASPGTAAAPASPNSSDPTVGAIQAVIQKANQEQQDAFARGDPTVMMDTATSSYYDQLAKINSDMAGSGISAIKLLNTEWGQIQVTGATTAKATTFETWQTSYSDGSTDQARQENDYALVQEQGSWKIQSDDNPYSPSGTPGGAPVSPGGPPTAPQPPAPSVSTTPASQTDTSRNWSGYAATSGSFSGVTGSWTIPESQSSGRLSSGATWVGLGGVHTRDLIQAGTEETTTGSGAVQYDAWIEMLPRASRPISLAVRAGDSITVSITEQGPNQWKIAFTNNTTSETYQTTVQYSSSMSSAEWIEEAPTAGRRLLPLDNFGTVQFTGGTAVDNGKNVTIEQAGAQPITLTDGRGAVLAAPSVLTPDGQGFSVSKVN